MTDHPGPWQPGWSPEPGAEYVSYTQPQPDGESTDPTNGRDQTSRSRGFGTAAKVVTAAVGGALLAVTVMGMSGHLDSASGDPTPDLQIGAGDQIYVDFPTSNPDHPCTVAAVGEGDRGKFAITTGYCTPVEKQQIAHRGEPVGTVAVSEVNIGDYSDRFQPGGNSYDYALIAMPNSVTLRPSGARVERPDMGERVCMEGSVSGRQCGEVGITPNGTVHVQEMDARNGDQGAPLYSEDGEVLYGMLSQLATPRNSDLIFVSMHLTLSQLSTSELLLSGELK